MTVNLRRRIRNLSIRRKLILITLSTCGIAVLLAIGIFVGLDLPVYRSGLERDLVSTATMANANSKVAVAFADADAATEILSALSAKPLVLAGCLYGQDGHVFAAYRRQVDGTPCPAGVPSGDSGSFFANRITTAQKVVDKEREFGTLYLEADLQPLYDRLRWHAALTAIVLLICGIAVVLMATPLQGMISVPIVRLADTMRTVKREQRYDIRASKDQDDEVGTLIEGFNDMLSEIEHRDLMLRRHQEQLEEEVTGRTAELSQVNVDLDGGEEPRRGRQPGEERVPGEHEP